MSNERHSEVRRSDEDEESEKANVLEKSPETLMTLLTVGILLSLTMVGAMNILEIYAKCPHVTVQTNVRSIQRI